MAIDDPRAIEYTTTIVRPLAERLRNLKAEVDQALTQWYTVQSGFFPNDSTVVADRTGSPQWSQITGADVNNVVSQLLQYQEQLDQPGVREVIERPCIQPLRAR